MQNPIIYLVLKRLRIPLFQLIFAYTVAIVGLTLIPGVDDQGNVWHVSYFHAFYFFSYVATTIGFGEIPYEFTDAQRLWVIFCIYLTVISWLMAIGKIISLLQDPALKMVLTKQRFIKQIKRIDQKFFIICGYGETGEILVSHLHEKGYQCVVIDSNPDRINILDLDSTVYNVPYLQADASDVEALKMAGVNNPFCFAVIAITNNDNINVKISVAAKLLKNKIKVICRAESKEAVANAKSFDTDSVLNPYRIFAENMSMAFRTPTIQQLLSSLLRRPGRDYSPLLTIPKGEWIISGYERFGQEIGRFLDYEGIDFTIVDSHADESKPKQIKGKGTEAVTLRAAGIENAVGIIAGNHDDADNLSIIMTARHLRPNLYLVARQNHDSNRTIFQSADIDLVMESARLLVWQIVPLLTQRYLSKFFKLARHQEEEWGKALMAQLQNVTDKVPESYLLKINEKHAQPVLNFIQSGNILRLRDIIGNPNKPDDELQAIVLMLVRDGKEELLPKVSMPIKAGDIFLMASEPSIRNQIRSTIYSEQDLYFLIHGKEKPVSIVLSLIREKLKAFKKQKNCRKKRTCVNKTNDNEAVNTSQCKPDHIE